MDVSSHPLPPVPADSPTNSGGVRRHHTISASSRTARTAAKDIISEESQEQALWNDDEPVDQDWVGGVGAVGEKSSLHRQSSLPTRYHRAFQNQGSKSGSITPKVVNSLAAIAGHEGDEEPWNLAGYSVQDDEHQPQSEQLAPQHAQVIETQAQSQQQPASSPLSLHFAAPPRDPSPPPAESGVRRHVSLTYGSAIGGPRKMHQPLKRSGTLQATVPAHPSSTDAESQDRYEEEEYTYDAYDVNDEQQTYEDEYYQRQQPQQQQQVSQQGFSSPLGRSSPWGSSDWRGASTAAGYSSGTTTNATMDDVQRALSALEIASNANTTSGYAAMGYGGYQQQQQQQTMGQSVHPPRFNPSQPPPQPVPGGQRSGNNGNNGNGNGGGNKLEFDGRKTPLGRGLPNASSTYGQQAYPQFGQQQQRDDQQQRGSWDQNQKERIISRTSNPNLSYMYMNQQQGGGGGHSKSASTSSIGNNSNSSSNSNNNNVPSVPPIPQQYLQQNQQQQRSAGVTSPFNPSQTSGQATAQQAGAFAAAPVDVAALIATKGYNPANFDIRPPLARFFVIKSYTEDDVHKSLKYEIWSSTDPGNKRLDKAFKETAGRGPIYLFFSVNASGHFCGMAEMLTPVDYTRSSTVWASDKWKGVFKVRWIFVRDIPNVNLRHIKLNNTQERKPVTNSRDTQELLPDAGQEMLRIFHTHPARTSLLQDFAFYELQAMQKLQAQQQGGNTSPTASQSPQMQPAAIPTTTLQQQQQQQPQNAFNMSPNPNALAYQMPQMTPMMQMQMQMGINMGLGSQFAGLQQTQAMHQSVMRHPSPGPSPPPLNGGQQGFMGMPTF